MKRILLAAFGSLVFLTVGTPLWAQEAAQAAQGLEPGVWTEVIYKWAIIAGAGALAFAAAAGAYSQGRAAAAACDAISRNPGAAPQIRFTFLLGVVLIESLVIYVFVISLSILFVKWPA